MLVGRVSGVNIPVGVTVSRLLAEPVVVLHWLVRAVAVVKQVCFEVMRQVVAESAAGPAAEVAALVVQLHPQGLEAAEMVVMVALENVVA